jgi:hydroxyacylglutathione hydrolase
MPTNTQLAIYTEECEKKRRMHQPTVPSVLSTELEINPFLRHNDPEIFSILKDKGLIESHNNLEVFRAIRKAKDSF